MHIDKNSDFDHENLLRLDPREVADYCKVDYAPLPTTDKGGDLPMLIHFVEGGDPLPVIAKAVKEEGVTAIHRVSIKRIFEKGCDGVWFNIFLRVFK